MTNNTPSTALNTDQIVLWFDDLGSGNEEFNFLSNFFEGEPLVLPLVFWEGTYKVTPVEGTDQYGAPLPPRIHFTKFSSEDEYRHHPVEFQTGEHAFQALKAHTPEDFYYVATASDPNETKFRGRTISLRPDWEQVKYDVMAAVVRAKYTLDREEGKRLLETGDRLLVEGTWWKDEVWGVDLNAAGLPGRNWLGTLLMARRAELRAMQTFPQSQVVQFFGNKTVIYNNEYAG